MNAADEARIGDRIVAAFGEDKAHRFVRQYKKSVKDDTGLVPTEALDDEVCTTLEFIEELLTHYEKTKGAA